MGIVANPIHTPEYRMVVNTFLIVDDVPDLPALTPPQFPRERVREWVAGGECAHPPRGMQGKALAMTHTRKKSGTRPRGCARSYSWYSPRARTNPSRRIN
jgi:hypothetical protein